MDRELPAKPSELIRTALVDLERVEKSSQRALTIHSVPRQHPVDTFAAEALTSTSSRSLSDVAIKLNALDGFCESTHNGLRVLAILPPDGIPDRYPPSYESNPAGFKAALAQIADDLEGAHL